MDTNQNQTIQVPNNLGKVKHSDVNDSFWLTLTGGMGNYSGTFPGITSVDAVAFAGQEGYYFYEGNIFSLAAPGAIIAPYPNFTLTGCVSGTEEIYFSVEGDPNIYRFTPGALNPAEMVSILYSLEAGFALSLFFDSDTVWILLDDSLITVSVKDDGGLVLVFPMPQLFHSVVVMGEEIYLANNQQIYLFDPLQGSFSSTFLAPSGFGNMLRLTGSQVRSAPPNAQLITYTQYLYALKDDFSLVALFPGTDGTETHFSQVQEVNTQQNTLLNFDSKGHLYFLSRNSDSQSSVEWVDPSHATPLLFRSDKEITSLPTQEVLIGDGIADQLILRYYQSPGGALLQESYLFYQDDPHAPFNKLFLYKENGSAEYIQIPIENPHDLTSEETTAMALKMSNSGGGALIVLTEMDLDPRPVSHLI